MTKKKAEKSEQPGDPLPLNTTRAQVVILEELFGMEGLKFAAKDGIAVGTLLELCRKRLAE